MKVYCWVCMKREARSAGSQCAPCAVGVPDMPDGRSAKRARTKDMTLDELVATQESGWVPEDRRYQANESAMGILHNEQYS